MSRTWGCEEASSWTLRFGIGWDLKWLGMALLLNIRSTNYVWDILVDNLYKVVQKKFGC